MSNLLRRRAALLGSGGEELIYHLQNEVFDRAQYAVDTGVAVADGNSYRIVFNLTLDNYANNTVLMSARQSEGGTQHGFDFRSFNNMYEFVIGSRDNYFKNSSAAVGETIEVEVVVDGTNFTATLGSDTITNTYLTTSKTLLLGKPTTGSYYSWFTLNDLKIYKL